jgi:hypothetical protein
MSLPVANRGLFLRMSFAFTGIFTFLVSVTHPRGAQTCPRPAALDPVQQHWVN